MSLVNPTTATGKKFNAAAIGGAVATLVTWGIGQGFGIDAPAEVGVAIGVLCTFVASVLIPDSFEE